MSKQSERPLQLPVGRQDLEFKVNVVYGHVEVNSWFEFDGERFIGMGSSTHYDSDGNVTAHNVSPTGLVGYFSGPAPRRSLWKRLMAWMTPNA